MEITREAIEQAVESYRQEMLDYWKELVNFQAGSKEGERMFALLSQVNAKLNREGFASELLPTGSPIPLLRGPRSRPSLVAPIRTAEGWYSAISSQKAVGYRSMEYSFREGASTRYTRSPPWAIRC